MGGRWLSLDLTSLYTLFLYYRNGRGKQKTSKTLHSTNGIQTVRRGKFVYLVKRDSGRIDWNSRNQTDLCKYKVEFRSRRAITEHGSGDESRSFYGLEWSVYRGRTTGRSSWIGWASLDSSCRRMDQIPGLPGFQQIPSSFYIFLFSIVRILVLVKLLDPGCNEAEYSAHTSAHLIDTTSNRQKKMSTKEGGRRGFLTWFFS